MDDFWGFVFIVFFFIVGILIGAMVNYGVPTCTPNPLPHNWVASFDAERTNNDCTFRYVNEDNVLTTYTWTIGEPYEP